MPAIPCFGMHGRREGEHKMHIVQASRLKHRAILGAFWGFQRFGPHSGRTHAYPCFCFWCYPSLPASIHIRLIIVPPRSVGIKDTCRGTNRGPLFACASTQSSLKPVLEAEMTAIITTDYDSTAAEAACSKLLFYSNRAELAPFHTRHWCLFHRLGMAVQMFLAGQTDYLYHSLTEQRKGLK